MPSKKIGNPKSIRWKWGFLLSIAFFLMYFISASLLLNQSNNQVYEGQKKSAENMLHSVQKSLSEIDTKLTINSVESLFEKISVSTVSKGLQTVGNYPFLDDLKARGINIRVFDTDGQLLYETQKSYTTFIKNPDTYLRETTLNNLDAFVAGSPIMSQEGSNLMGYVQIVFRLNDYHKIRSHNTNFYLYMTTAAFILSIAAGYGIAFYFFRPIKQMVDTMNEIEEDTLSETRIKISNSKDEFTDLSVHINGLLDKMALYVSQQKQFVEDVSHELRTPTAIVEGHLKLLNRWGKEDPQILDESLSASLTEIQRMKTLVQEMLDLSRAEQVEIHYKNEVTPILNVVLHTFHNFKMLYPDFVFNLDNDLKREVYVNIYRNHFEQILVILMDNAVKYSTDRHEIHLSISESMSYVQIAIQDFGEGMSQEDQQKIFARFYRVDKARSRNKGGNGLGLSIAKELLEGYKGDITVESVLGHGSIFRIQLPILKDYVPEEEL
jgi:signal transduction histidine kinase